jgi:hypothetical protein
VSRHCQDCTNAESTLQTFSVFAGNVSAPQPCFCSLLRA